MVIETVFHINQEVTMPITRTGSILNNENTVTKMGLAACVCVDVPERAYVCVCTRECACVHMRLCGHGCACVLCVCTHACAYVCVSVDVPAHAHVCGCVPMDARAYDVPAQAHVCACARECACVRMRLCGHACACARMCVYRWMRAHAYTFSYGREKPSTLRRAVPGAALRVAGCVFWSEQLLTGAGT